MRKNPARLIALTLSLALCTTALPIHPACPAEAEAVAAGALRRASGELEDKPNKPPTSKNDAPDGPSSTAGETAPAERPAAGSAPVETQAAGPAMEAPGEAATVETAPPKAPSDAPSAAPTQSSPEAPSDSPTAVPTQSPPEAPSDTPKAMPSQSPPESPSDTPTAVSSQSPPETPSDTPNAMPSQSPPEAPAETPTAAPTASPAGIPFETPAAPEGALAGAYQVSPREAVYMMGSLDPMTFAIEPPGAPFLGVEGMECAYADGVVTLGAEKLDALGAGEHVLAFLFEGGGRVEVCLTVVAASAVSKGPMEYLLIGGTTYDSLQLSEDRSNPAQHWAWNAATATLTLDGYDGGGIHARGMKPLTVATAAGSVNTIASSEDASLYSDYGLILTGGGTLNVTNSTGSAVESTGAIAIESGAVRASGKKRAFYSKLDEIRVSGGVVEVRHANRQGDGFSAKGSTRVSGGSVAVEGAASAFGSLIVRNGTVTVRDCEVGADGGLSASGGVITMEDVAQSAEVSDQAMRFTDCTLSISGCGEYGLHAGGDLTVGKGANLTIEAGRIALYAVGGARTIRIEKGANLDLSGGEGALKGAKVLIGGKAYTGSYNHVVIRNGEVVRRENAMQSLTAGGRSYGASSLSGDLFGGGWAWSASSKALTLNGYDGGAVSAVGSPISLSLQGENRIGGGLTLTGAVVTGGGSLTTSRVAGKVDLEIRSGTVSAERIALGGGLIISGGVVNLSGGGADPAAECKDFSMTGGKLTLSSQDDSQPAGIRASGKAAIRGGAVAVRNFGDFLRAAGDVAVTGGSISVGDNTGEGVASEKTIKATGGTISIQSARCAMTAKGVVISGKPTLSLKSTSRTAFDAKSVKIAGKTYSPRYSGVIIEGGRLTEDYKLLPDLIIGGREFSMKQLNAHDQSGDGWSWSARKNTLTLSGYRGNGIWINRNLTVAMAPGTVNSGSEDYGGAAIHSTENLSLGGSGRWDGGIFSAGGLKLSGNPLIAASAIRSNGGVAILGGRIQVSGGIEAESGDVLIRNARVAAGRVRGARVEILKSSLTTTEGGNDLTGDRGLTISSSIAFCSQFAAPHGKVKISGSAVFRRGSGGGGEVWALAQSASITRDMTLPPGKNCLVPAGRTLSIAKGKRLYVYGSLAVEGVLKGAVIRRSEAGGVVIQGSAQVAKGRSVRLSAQVVPATSGGQADQVVSWSSDSPRLLSVSDRGIVTATVHSKPGDAASITCRALDGTGVEETWCMTVTEPVKKLTILRDGAPVSRLSASRSAGPIELDVRVEPEGASSGVHWTSSNAAVASVDPIAGTVRLVKKGSAIIRCAATDGTNAEAIMKLTVK